MVQVPSAAADLDKFQRKVNS